MRALIEDFITAVLMTVAAAVVLSVVMYGLYVGYFWLFGDHGPFSMPGITN